VDELLDLVSLNPEYKQKYPHQLSGGEKQRVGLARALASDPEILLMDEPFGAIDPINRTKLHESFLEIQKKIKKTIVFVTHDINEAIKLGDNLVILKKGMLVQNGKLKTVLNNPKNNFVKSLLGEDRNLKGLVLKKSYDFANKKYLKIIKNKNEIDKTFLKKDKRNLIILKDKKRIKGYFKYQNKNNEEKIKYYSNIVKAGKYSNLREILSKMMEFGEDVAFICSKDIFLGVIRLADILKEMGSNL
jgi:osmoprotectant transport system ATP-binding protein